MYDALKSAWEDLKDGENLDLYVALAATTLFLILDLIGVGKQWIDSVIVAALTILLLSTLVQRQRDKSLLQALLNSGDTALQRDKSLLRAIWESRDPILLDEMPRERMKQDIIAGNEVWLIGILLRTTGDELFQSIQARIEQLPDYRVRILVVDPNGSSLSSIAFRSKEPIGPDIAESRIRDSLLTLCNLRSLSTHIEIRVIDHALPFGLIAADVHSDTGVIYYEQYPFKDDDKPAAVFHPSDHPWFAFYRNQIRLLWNHATPWDCRSDKHSSSATQQA